MMRYSLLVTGLVLLSLHSPATDTRRGLQECHQEAVRLLTQAADAMSGGNRKQASQPLASAAQCVYELSRAGTNIFPPGEQTRLKQVSKDLRDLSHGWSDEGKDLLLVSCLSTVYEIGRYFQPPAPQVTFRRTYASARTIEQGGGGHASALGPVPVQKSALEDMQAIERRTTSGLDFREIPIIKEKNFSGGPDKEHILESGGGGVALFDYDNDGLLDIYIVNSFELTSDRKLIPHRNRLYHNLGNWQFEDVSRKAGVDVAGWGYGVCAGDYNNDGYLDIYVTNFGPNLLFRNNGDGTFTEVAGQAGVNHGGWSTGCSFFDADGDGSLDLYVARYAEISWKDILRPHPDRLWRGGPRVMSGPVGLPGAADILYHNDGHGRFSDGTRSLGLLHPDQSYGFGVLTTDYDNDGWIDVYVANDSHPNFLFHNLGKGRFEEVGIASSSGVNAEGRAQAGMGVDAGDYDGDGLIDFIVTTFAHDTKTLYRNLGAGLFEDVSLRSGLSSRTFERMGWGVAFFDADRDGQLDLFLANGHLFPQVEQYPQLGESYSQKNQLLLNQGGRFKDVSEIAGSGLQVRRSSRGVAIGDLDNDGNLDIVITNMDDVPTVLQNRTKNAHHWAGFQLNKEGNNPFCIGAKIVINAGGQKQSREVRSGGSYLSQNDLRAHFGLGSYDGKVDVEVRMPGGDCWRWKGLATDRIVTLVLREKETIRTHAGKGTF